MQAMFADELLFLESCLRVNPKSYGVWQHRCFVMDTTPVPDWKQELQLCNLFLEYDERNCRFPTCSKLLFAFLSDLKFLDSVESISRVLEGLLIKCMTHNLESPGNQHFIHIPQCFLPFSKQVVIFQSN